MQEHSRIARFEQTVLPHLDAAYNLARWLMRNDQDAEDMVQEACLRALRFFDGFHGVDSRGWLLAIVRNTCYTWLRHNRAHELATPFDEDIHGAESEALNPETIVQRSAEGPRSSGGAAARISRGRRAARARGTVVQRDCRHRRHTDRHRNVAPGARAPPAPALPGRSNG